ncbi:MULTISPECIES: DEAD/DEAH box helicase [Alistipes]|jgi:superfamily II DNA/RNA helicase|uniref:DEAD/DEAH box helicase n=1 Tax=Alistipes TaxID=239759 RepID=UPI00204170D2|nr:MULTISPECIES: DEAD/DEAH box helicase [Alistipes]MCX4282461.1 DEAD/DEAH box helicase [Alistipes sp.]HUN14656.1 DEAD/DEAH box helicase [Alistipes sp.]
MRFDELDLEDEILDGLYDMNFSEMTPVQEHTIPVILSGRDIIGCAQTGTGKTAAYTLPLLNRLLIEGNPDNVIKSVIIVPTRELAQQIDQQFQGFSYYLPVSTTVVYGGGDGKGWDVQKRGMLMGSDVVIATPGRMISHLQNSGIDLSRVECLILDEADRMLDMGFSDDIMKIVSYMPKERQTIMFSATLPPKIRELAKTILRNPAEVNIAISKPNEAIDQSAYVCYESQKLGIIRELFAQPADFKTIIFSSSKLKVKELAHTLKRMKLNVAAMHSDLEQAQREEVMLAFKNNKINILVATDIVARGIDIEDIGLVINYDVPHDPEDYIHRIGRTARAAATGSAITFVSEDEQGKFHQIEKFIERDIRKADLPESVGEGPKYAPSENRGRGGRGRSGSGRGGRDRGGRKRSGQKSGGSAAAQSAAEQPVNPAAAAPADSNHASGRGEGNRGSRDRKRRHRGGRRHRRPVQSQED